jgi:hypothetical protein
MALTGQELLQVQGVQANGQPAATTFQTTTGAIAELASVEGSLVETAIATVGNGTLTAAALVGGQIARNGPVAAYTDTTDTAANIVTAIGGFVSGSTFIVRIKNATDFTQTLSAGTGVTLPATTINAPFSFYQVFGTVGGTAASPTVVFTHMGSAPIANNITVGNTASTALSTVGAGTITAAGIVAGLTTRSGAQLSAAFTDTTDTANAIIAAQPGMVNKIGTSFWWEYLNTTNAPATIAAGSGVTVSTITIVPPNSWAEYLVTYTAASTLTFAGGKQGYLPNGGTVTMAGTAPVTVSNTNITTFSQVSFTLKSVGGTVGAIPAIKTITPGTGFTVAGTVADVSVYNYNIQG